MVLTLGKVWAAVERIRRAQENWGHRIYVAYSGGKDSKAVWLLAKLADRDITVIHNQHPGETAPGFGVLHVLPPKAVTVPQFLASVDLRCQIDGTRRDEDKTVIFDGKEIHRSLMPTYQTDNGVFGLAMVFPLWDWTEVEVLEFLEFSPLFGMSVCSTT
jgi:3'-phosphoadenosine 5'-phosphosulfate sulfotransferase (PAPS reductase)/FAD synthetase